MSAPPMSTYCLYKGDCTLDSIPIGGEKSVPYDDVYNVRFFGHEVLYSDMNRYLQVDRFPILLVLRIA